MNYAKLYLSYTKRSILSRLEYKRDALLSIFNFFISNVAAVLSIYFIMESIPSLEGWTMAEIGFLYGFSMMPVALDHIFTDDLWNVAYNKVRFGEMDPYFLKPVPVLFQIIAGTFQIEGFGELIVGIIMLSICGSMVNIVWNFGVVFLFIIATIFGALIITSLKIIFASMAFKMKNSGPLLQVVYNFISYTRYPRKIYPSVLRALLTFVFPFMTMISFPVEIAMGKFNESPYLFSLVIASAALLFLALSLLIWTFFAKRYESTGN